MNSLPKAYRKLGLFRYLAIIFYDIFLLSSVLIFAGFVAVALNGGKAISHDNVFFLCYLIIVSFLFYGWCWTKGGQTLGMRAWHVWLVSCDNKKITWRQAFMRFSVAILSCLTMGLGFWWQYISKNKRSWPDMASNTTLYYKRRLH